MVNIPAYTCTINSATLQIYIRGSNNPNIANYIKNARQSRPRLFSPCGINRISKCSKNKGFVYHIYVYIYLSSSDYNLYLLFMMLNI